MPPSADKLNAERQRLRVRNAALIEARQRDLEDDDKEGAARHQAAYDAELFRVGGVERDVADNTV